MVDAILKKFPEQAPAATRPTREEAEAAVATLIRWAGDDPAREGLRDTPARVVRSYEDLFAGYRLDAAEALSRTFREVSGYDDVVVVRDIDVQSHCEHHMLPVLGKAHIAYLPAGRVLGLSKMPRVVEVFARRLQTQEAMTAQIATAIEETLRPRGVAVLIEAEHLCMSMRGVRAKDSMTLTTTFRGMFAEDRAERDRITSLMRARP